MEYYNLIGKENFEIYYRNKINGLLLNPEIMEYLESHSKEINDLCVGYDWEDRKIISKESEDK